MKNTLARLAGITTACALFAPIAEANEGESLYKEVGCAACHTVDKKRMGPTFRDVAAKYKGQADAIEHLHAKVRKGGGGVWGTVPMPAHPPERVTDEELRTILAWVLSH